MKARLQQLKQERIELDEDSVCLVCFKRLQSSVFVFRHNGVATHVYCGER